jgi:hypothetical protein
MVPRFVADRKIHGIADPTPFTIQIVGSPMPAVADLDLLVEKLASAIPDMNLSGDEQEEYSTMLLWLQNQVETGEPSEAIVNQCLAYFRRRESRAA